MRLGESVPSKVCPAPTRLLVLVAANPMALPDSSSWWWRLNCRSVVSKSPICERCMVSSTATTRLQWGALSLGLGILTSGKAAITCRI